ncbi:MAG: hypothetical protein IT379_07150, partial [Deltaproteobacteria bacterium]|nr:hypothetical protein [Deltaproteobacteria bacterium]
MQRARWIPVVLFLVVPACGDDDDGDATDAGPRSDGSIVLDSGGRDLGADASGPDMATEDASSADSGASDGAPADAGADGAPADAGDADGGTRPDGGAPMDDCTLDADCPSGICWPSPDGARRCTMRIDPPLDGCEGGFEPCCLRDADCVDGPGGRCAAFTFGYCGGAAPPPGNTCRYDGCATDADCGGGICLPPGAIGNLNAACVAA